MQQVKISNNCSKIWKTRSLSNTIQEFSLAYIVITNYEQLNHVLQIWWRIRDFWGRLHFLFYLRFLYFVGVFNQTIILAALVGNKSNSLHVARNICSRTSPVPRSEQFSESVVQGKLWALKWSGGNDNVHGQIIIPAYFLFKYRLYCV